MSTELKFVLAVFACYRITLLFAWDLGPEDMFYRIRSSLGVRASTGSSFWRFWADLVNCPYCLGIWVAFLITILFFVLPSIIGEVFLVFFGIAGGQAFLQSLFDVAKNRA